MRTIIANPIYDVVFKHMMENMQVAKILLSALLKREVVHLEFGRNEFSKTLTTQISIFRIDFSALVIGRDGKEERVTIEIQKTWGTHEMLRFRQYLSKQYLAQENLKMMDDGHGFKRYYGVPLITIYILGHRVGNIKEPVIYVRRKYFDYDENIVGCHDNFIESISHDSIIVQIPLLHGRTQNYLGRILQIFDQKYMSTGNNHLLDLDDLRFISETDLEPVIRCLTKIASDPELKEEMDAEDIYLAEMQLKDTQLMEQQKELDANKQELDAKDKVLKEKDKVLEANKQELDAKDKELEASKNILQIAVRLLSNSNLTPEEIAMHLSISVGLVVEIMSDTSSN